MRHKLTEQMDIFHTMGRNDSSLKKGDLILVSFLMMFEIMV